MAYTTIKPQDNFNSVLYTGDETPRTITVGLQPDFTWTKARSSAHSHIITDSVTGVGKRLRLNVNNAQDTSGASVESFVSTGYTLTNDATINETGTTNVSWNFKAGTTSGITTNGSTTITPIAYSFNATTGFSIIHRNGTGAAGLFPHGLGATPGIVLTKTLNTSNNWFLQSNLLGANSWTADNYLSVNTAASKGSSSAIVNAADSVNVSLAGSDDWVNSSSNSYVDYIWTPVQGYSAMGIYEGNGNADGCFVYCGFRPAFVMVKNTSTSDNFNIVDDKRVGYNFSNYRLFANDGAVENTSSGRISILSNGFVVKSADADCNGSGNKIFYMAFASDPLVYSDNDIALAR
jgi:hypothetical protein|tara:strand:- start:52 stop:1098 length:1047 start_codon:yes stop_codon:yes gene_type:complete